MNRIALFIPTYNGHRELARLLESLDRQTSAFDLFVIDSSSKDGTDKIARKRGCNLIIIPRDQFNHGGTRQMMVNSQPNYDIYIFLTQDAYLDDEHALNRIVAPFADSSVGAAYGRQLPHLDANPFAAHARLFNYPSQSRIKSIDDVAELGIKTPFISNSFAAYRREALEDVGGFPNHVILSEDMYVAARMLLQGWKIAYAGDACCRHSHNYSLLEEFRRYFDIGVFHAREPWIRDHFGSVGSEGLQYVVSELLFLGWQRIHLWPEALLRNALKLVGFKLGLSEKRLPLALKWRLSMHKPFWNGEQS